MWSLCLALLSPGVAVGAGAAAADGGRVSASAASNADAAATGVIPADRRESLLGSAWQKSADWVWTTSGDATGFHIMVADEARGCAWRTVATLGDARAGADSWIGNACVTASGRRLVVAYAPRTFTNDPVLFSRGAQTAVVDLRTGAVTTMAVRSTLAYYSPSCGTGEQAVITARGGAGNSRPRLVRIDAATASAAAPIEVAGQLTSAVPTPAGIVAAKPGALVHVDDTGAVRTLAATDGVPFRLATDADGAWSSWIAPPAEGRS